MRLTTPPANQDIVTHEQTEPSWTIRFGLLFGIISGIGYALTTIQYSPEQLGIASRVYYHAAIGALEAENFYLIHPPDDPGYRFLYPPIVVLLFVPHASLGSPSLAFALQLGLNVSAVLALSIVLISGLKRSGTKLTTLDKALLIGFIGVSPYGITQIIQGQVTLWLALAISLGLWYLETNTNATAGLLVALPAVVKLFPGSLGLYFLRSRNWSAILTALITGGLAILVGIIVFGFDLTTYYFLEVLPYRMTDRTVTGTPDPRYASIGLSRQLAAIFPGTIVLQYGVMLLISGSVIGVLYRSFATDIHRQSALLGTIVLTLLVLPLDPLYFSLFVYPLCILLYTRIPPQSQYLLISGILLTTLLIGYSTIEIALNTIAFSPLVESFIREVTHRVFSFVLPPTIGLYLLLASCLSIHLQQPRCD